MRSPPVPSPTPARGPGIAARHARDGLDIGPETLAYRGESFDLGLTIDCLLSQVGRWGLPVGGDGGGSGGGEGGGDGGGGDGGGGSGGW